MTDNARMFARRTIKKPRRRFSRALAEIVLDRAKYKASYILRSLIRQETLHQWRHIVMYVTISPLPLDVLILYIVISFGKLLIVVNTSHRSNYTQL